MKKEPQMNTKTKKTTTVVKGAKKENPMRPCTPLYMTE
jgi:hypothetical protein